MISRLEAILADRLATIPGAMSPSELLHRDVPDGLEAPGVRSANRHCRLLEACDGWVALNLARPEDRDVLPALIGGDGKGWDAVESAVRREGATEFRDRAIELQLPVAVLNETPACRLGPAIAGRGPRRVVDLSALWAGPLCAGLLARGGAKVLRIDSLRRPDPTPTASPELDQRINGGKERLTLDLSSEDGRSLLLNAIRAADVLITSARPAALARLGLTPRVLLAECPGLIWVAINAYGFAGEGAVRVGFGDDCAVAGGLVRWNAKQPHFLGDALADPLTGLEAALAVLRQKSRGGDRLIDVSLAQVAADYAQALQA